MSAPDTRRRCDHLDAHGEHDCERYLFCWQWYDFPGDPLKVLCRTHWAEAQTVQMTFPERAPKEQLRLGDEVKP